MKTSDLYRKLYSLEATLEDKNAQLLKLNDEIEALEAQKEEALDELAKTLGMVPAKSDNMTTRAKRKFCASRREFLRRNNGLMQVLAAAPNTFRSCNEIVSKAIAVLHLNPACETTRKSLSCQLRRLGEDGHTDRERAHVNAEYAFKPKAVDA